MLTSSSDEPGVRRSSFSIVTVLGAAVICVKLSALAFVICGWLIALIWWFKRDPDSVLQRFRVAAIAVCAGLLFIVPWAVRGAILSGYVGYPANLICIDRDWTVPAEQCDESRDWVLDYGRSVANEMRLREDKRHFAFWFPIWLKVVIVFERDRLIMPALFALFWLIASARRVFNYRGIALQAWIALLPVVGGLLFWMWASPGPRFGFQNFSIGYAVIGCGAILAGVPQSTTRARRALIMTLAIVPLLQAPQIALNYAIKWKVTGTRPPITQLTRAVILELPDAGGFWKTQPSQNRAYVTNHGVTVWVPKSGDFMWDAPPAASHYRFMWDAPLPASHYRNPDLRMRIPGNLQGGFSTTPSQEKE
jgi:hypothetical protein